MKKIKRVMGLFAMIAVLTINLVPTNAQNVNTGIHSSTGTYNLYIRKSGSTESLGRMTLYHDVSHAYNYTIIYVDCDIMDLRVSGKSSVFTQMSSSYRLNMKAGQSNKAQDLGVYDSNGLMRVYGYTSLTY